MQSYALAVAELAPRLNPSLKDAELSIGTTLHFLDPNREFHLSPELLSADACTQAIDNAMMDIVSSAEPGHFPVRPATHCRTCSFLGICAAGRDWVNRKQAGLSIAAKRAIH
jgi:hypothetical protein